MKTTITLDKAAELLKANSNNRNISPKLVKLYAKEMREGNWQYNGDPIRVSKSGALLDGQHRLLACIEAKKPFTTELIEGLPDEVMETLDIGRKRRPADAMIIAGLIHGANIGGMAATVGAVIKVVINYLAGDHLSTAVSTPATMKFIKAHPDVGEIVQLVWPSRSIVTPTSLAAVLWLGTRATNPGVDMLWRAEAFANAIPHGENLAGDDPRLALRNRMLDLRQRGGGRLPPPWQTVPLVTAAWNAFVKQQPMVQLRVRTAHDGTVPIYDVIGGPRYGDGEKALKRFEMPDRMATLLRGGKEELLPPPNAKATKKVEA